ncbi:MAG: IS66 family transposase [Clostridia bacterium]
MDSKDAYIVQLENTIKSLERQVNNLTEMVILLRKQKFGSSSEKTPKDETEVQLSIFNEAELEASPEAQEPAERELTGIIAETPKQNVRSFLKTFRLRKSNTMSQRMSVSVPNAKQN